jgi:ABC-type lipoprotein export system ATPase subunit
MTTEPAAVEAIGLTRTYSSGGRPLLALDNISFTVARGETVAIMGPSGSGKSTLLYLLGGLDIPDAGSVRVAGVDWKTLHGSERARFLRRNCGFIAQGLALLPQATAAENIEVPLLFGGIDPIERNQKVVQALERVGLGEHSAKLTDQLSGGQQQRVSIARALVNEPAVVLADEPTGNLDSVTAQEVTRLLVSVGRELGSAIIIVTHDPAVARHADRTLLLHSGRLVGKVEEAAK